MPNARYEKSKSKMLNGEISWINDNIKIALLNSSYPGGFTSLENHEFYSDIAPYVLTGTTNIISLVNKSVIVNGKHGYANSDDIELESITAGQTIAYIVLFKDSGPEINGAPLNGATSPLIVMIDSGYGIGSGTNGSNVLISWNADNGIFKI